MKFRFWLALSIMALFVTTACTTTDEDELKYKVLILNEAGDVIENASVTPKVIGLMFKTKFTKFDGLVDLNAMYSQKPTTIMVRAINYKTQVVPWSLPSAKPQTVIMKTLSIPSE
jgi:hypothetical protein